VNVDLGESGRLALAHARGVAAELGSSSVEPEHLFLGVWELRDHGIRQALLKAGLDMGEAALQLRGRLEHGRTPTEDGIGLSYGAEAALEEAAQEAVRLGQRKVEAYHILLALLEDEGGELGLTLRDLTVNASAARQTLLDSIEAGETTPSGFYSSRRTVEQEELSRTSHLLDTLGRDLTKAAEEGKLSPIIGRERETAELVKVLLGKRKNNAVLVGEPGVGKTAIVEGLAQKIAAREIPELEGKRVRSIEIGSLVAGTIYRGQLEQKVKDFIAEIRDRDDFILFIDEMHTMVGAGETMEGTLDVSNMMKPVLAEGTLKVIGATTLDEYRRYLEPAKALLRRFQTVVVGEPTREDALEILRGLKPKYEDFHMAWIADEALATAIDLAARYVHDRYLPDKALDLVDRACTEARLEARGMAGRPMIGPDDIAEVLSLRLEIPLARLTQDEKVRLTGMASALKQRVIGQDHAVDAVAQAIIRSRTGFGSPERPSGVFLFLGPSGVGKTKLAEELAAFLFGHRDELIQLDMSHYADPLSTSDLIGAKTGVVGWEQGGKLTNAVRSKPYSVVLLDEFEKAHPTVWNLFLPVFDEGRITDTLSRVVDFRNTVLIMTANVGARRFQTRVRVGFAASDGAEARGAVSFKDVEDEVMSDLRDTFSPELLNRVDEIVIFNALTRDHIRSIVRQRIAETVVVTIELTPDALEFLVDRSYDPAMGARPVRRTIQRYVANPLSLMVAKDELNPGDRVKVGLSKGELTFRTLPRVRGKAAPSAAG
jgi:ATP-dependent Clp protease ATP-binding subunit ClpC